MPRLALEPSDYPFFDYRRFTFSLGIAAARQVWLSGSTAARFDAARKAMMVDGDLVDQAGIIYDKMRVTLAAGLASAPRYRPHRAIRHAGGDRRPAAAVR